MKVDCVIFDLDGTLIDTTIYKKIYPEVIRMISLNKGISKKDIENTAKSLGMKKNKYRNYDSGDLSRHYKLLNEYYKILKKDIKITHSLNDGVIELLKKQGKRIGVASNSMKKTIMLHLKKYSLVKYVDFVFSYDDAKCRKNNINYWKVLIKKEKLTPSKCLVIGDNKIEDGKIPKSIGFETKIIRKGNYRSLRL